MYMNKNKKKPIEESRYRSSSVHQLLFLSYSVFLFSVILGVIMDIIFPFRIFSNIIFQYIGILMIILGSVIAYWAQSTSGNYKEEKAKLKNKTYFDRGPYKYLRSPTHFGLFIMTLGLALMINSLFSIIFTVLAQIITKIFFVRKQEKILEDKYGEVYVNYKKKVKNWL
ncbi:MAG: hypothetical protein UR85_C0002G0044 [Candidatus Nomurabacteria bacterium GW2011_GWF2_35_66]|uniref:Isoprenylcysteine carboxyl methyltransferase n=1 Tax=Candidatus Nomurabacteria bacterium GW2011_GWE1_35_16 TaxID=1618761 RepID=A0A0G0BB26_9BACT|nr:MAG: hypothetical protein UR55_C0004G0004 [Candidatus Nomurabacteria bacterium GW2011_GWF1_34_20]KKP63443.1 MAG: hypothetical protein UR57_C0004G0004 [Candidatus Nomurabacteria bacterium GW2011_GWE2_34_25]KKP66623.1 MAG: hypothetical protein UR64_C0004G0004 [Candidatus Nomurabacteria bacterium GW2011_GWE1_35_16]KKP83731.1 MAG: hypothetical protein UR85_C0002G0044 [Candidatus Nomurabacteria bacterium GW2011_GWF2_35_66]HAE36420.1 hypothetical protein [Candidatus Nomurabacteria bacterium]